MSTSPFPLNPGNNPTGMQYPVPGATTTSGTTNPFVSGTANPYVSQMRTAVPGAASAFPANVSPYSGRGGITMPNPMAGTIDPNSVPQDKLQNIYGPLGPVIQQLLASQGGYNQQAVNAILAQMQPGIQQGEENLMEQFGAAGGRFSSGAQLGLADYLSQVQLNEGDIMSQMYMQSYQNLMNEIMGLTGSAEQYQQTRPTAWDVISGILGAASRVGAAAAGRSSCYVAAELYGGWSTPEVNDIRRFIFTTWWMAPFAWLYSRIGPQWARWIRRNRRGRRMSKLLFDWFLRQAHG